MNSLVQKVKDTDPNRRPPTPFPMDVLGEAPSFFTESSPPPFPSPIPPPIPPRKPFKTSTPLGIVGISSTAIPSNDGSHANFGTPHQTHENLADPQGSAAHFFANFSPDVPDCQRQNLVGGGEDEAASSHDIRSEDVCGIRVHVPHAPKVQRNGGMFVRRRGGRESEPQGSPVPGAQDGRSRVDGSHGGLHGTPGLAGWFGEGSRTLRMGDEEGRGGFQLGHPQNNSLGLGAFFTFGGQQRTSLLAGTGTSKPFTFDASAADACQGATSQVIRSGIVEKQFTQPQVARQTQESSTGDQRQLEPHHGLAASDWRNLGRCRDGGLERQLFQTGFHQDRACTPRGNRVDGGGHDSSGTARQQSQGPPNDRGHSHGEGQPGCLGGARFLPNIHGNVGSSVGTQLQEGGPQNGPFTPHLQTGENSGDPSRHRERRMSWEAVGGRRGLLLQRSQHRERLSRGHTSDDDGSGETSQGDLLLHGPAANRTSSKRSEADSDFGGNFSETQHPNPPQTDQFPGTAEQGTHSAGFQHGQVHGTHGAGGGHRHQMSEHSGKTRGEGEPGLLWLHSSMLDQGLCKVLRAVKQPRDSEQVKKALWSDTRKYIPRHAPITDRIELFNGTLKLILKKCRTSFPDDC